MSDAFANVIGGGLKLKGALGASGGVKKKKSKSKDKEKEKTDKSTADASTALALASAGSPDGGAGGAGGAAAARPGGGPDRRTEAERKYEERLAKEEARIVAKMAAKTHREKVQEFNVYLSKLSEHHDIPRVGPG